MLLGLKHFVCADGLDVAVDLGGQLGMGFLRNRVKLALLRLVLALLVGCGSLLLLVLQPLRHYYYNAFKSSA